ncbi:MAG: TspO/MBR family protein [Ignavibacteria bacterium]|jgi:tryptophan-rich sensory protein
MVKADWLSLIICVVVCLLAGIIGSFFTSKNIPTWYATINKPTFKPPNWIFGPVWTVLYLMMGISLFLVWRQRDTVNISQAVMFFSIQLILNALWSFIFFGMKLLLLGFIEICLLWIFILLSIISFSGISLTASLLLIPYLLWVSYASVLNYFIFKLNN